MRETEWLREELAQIPVIETHVHYTANTERYHDAFQVILGYLKSDLRVAAGPGGGQLIRRLTDPDVSFDKRYALFERYYGACRFTAYATAMRRGLAICWGLPDVSYASLCALNERLDERDNAMLDRVLREARVEAQVADIFEPRFFRIMAGEDRDYWSGSYFAFPLPAFHRLYDGAALEATAPYIGEKPATLTEYAERVDGLLAAAKEGGAVCVKDQSAYFRTLDYGHPAAARAEEAYQRLAAYPWTHLGDEEGKALDDWLFQHFLDTAGRLELPVQLHTGLQDRIAGEADRNGGDCRRVDAALLIPTMERHARVRFDLFHASWPNMDSILFIGKNFPNAWIDLCWAQSIDPIYAVELMRRAAVCLPSTKLLGFGSDAFTMECGVGYLDLARDNIAAALAPLVASGYLTRNDAVDLATDWLYRNPKEFFNLRRKGEET